MTDITPARLRALADDPRKYGSGTMAVSDEGSDADVAHREWANEICDTVCTLATALSTPASETARRVLAMRKPYVQSDLLQVSDCAAALAVQNVALLAVVEKCATRFREYERHHSSRDVKDSNQKALNNRVMAEMCEAALRGAGGENG